MAFDFKKEFKEFYMPKNKPEIVTVPKPNFLKIMDIAMTLAMADFTMKSICPM